MLRWVILLFILFLNLYSFGYKSDSTLVKVKVIKGKITPKSIVHSGDGKFFAQNMMYKHTITVYDRNFNLLKTISDKVALNKFGFSNRKGLYRGAPVECTFTHNGKYAWVSNYNMTGGKKTEFVKSGCDNCHGTGVYDSSFVYKINTGTLSIEAIVKVGSVPKYLNSTPDNKYVLVTNWSSSDLSVIDTKKEKEIKRIKLGAYPRGIEVDSSGKNAYIAIMGSSKIAVINLKTFEKTWIKDVGRSPRHLCMSPKNDFLYVSLNGEGVVAKINLATYEIQKLKTGNLPRSMVLSGDGKFLYVVNYGSDKLTKVRTRDMRIMDNISTNDKPIGITFDNATKNIWVACYEGSIMVFHDKFYDSISQDELYAELLSQNSDVINFQLPTNENVVKNMDVAEEPIDNKYYLIAGSFKKPNYAKKLVADFKSKGYDSFTYFNTKNERTYACVESYSKKETAVLAVNKIKEAGVKIWIHSVHK